MQLLIAAAMGLTLGHGVALVFNRFFRNEPLRGPLHGCSACLSRFRPVDAVPLLSFLVTRGRCSTCDTRLSLRPLILSLGGAVLFVVSTRVFGNLGSGMLGGFFAIVFLTLALADIDRRLLPNRIVYPSIVIAIAVCWAWPDNSVLQILAGGLTAIGIGMVLLLFSLPFGADALGMGDIKMMVLIGFVVGLPAVLVAIFIGTVAAAVFGGIMIVTGRRSRRDYIPHGPFLAAGAIIALFWGADIWSAYRR
jgi:prepilin signal peptidase PulO-like enzyme (type II secretory pathway)